MLLNKVCIYLSVKPRDHLGYITQVMVHHDITVIHKQSPTKFNEHAIFHFAHSDTQAISNQI